MNPPIEKVEKLRLSIQHTLDDSKSQFERNRLGQFATPISLSLEIMKYANEIISKDNKIRFLDPAFGTGSFYSALLQVFESSRIQEAAGIEIDEQYAKEARRIWNATPLNLRVADFTMLKAPSTRREKADLIICNPPYVRHHYLTLAQKERLRCTVEKDLGIRVSGLSGLYCYYMLIAHKWLAEDGIAGWLVPSEFMDVNYGVAVKKYLLDKVMLLRIHRFDPNDVQFLDADVSSAVVWFKNRHPPENHAVEFTQGGTHSSPLKSRIIPTGVLRNASKWTAFPALDYENEESAGDGMVLSNLFTINRGLATGSNAFFIMDTSKALQYKLPSEFLIPILPMPRELNTDEVRSDDKGNPALQRRLFLLSCNLPENEVRTRFPKLWQYLNIGLELGVHERYLCKHRSPWYSQEKRPAAPFLCSYLGRITSRREKPFRFILNYSKATASNAYLMLYPKDELRNALEADPKLYKIVWRRLVEISTEALISSGRVYGGGLFKLEPKELSKVPADGILREAQISRHLIHRNV